MPVAFLLRGRLLSWAVFGCRLLTWLYLISVVLVWLALRLGGDVNWWATILLFGPRWIFSVPLVLLVPAAVVLRPRLLWPLAGAAGFLCFAVLGLCVPWRIFFDFAGEPPTLRVLTFNVDTGKGDLPGLDRLIEEVKPDLIALQECTEELAPKVMISSDWHVVRKHNLWLASRLPIEEDQAVTDDGQLGYWGTIALRCQLQTPRGAVRAVVLHLETPREGLDAVLSDSWAGRQTMEDEIERRAKISALASELAGDAKRTLVLGDFNMPVDSAIYRRDWSRLQNAFSRAGWGFGGSKMTRWFRVRIDHVLASGDWKVMHAWLGPPIGSDHRPLITELRLAE